MADLEHMRADSAASDTANLSARESAGGAAPSYPPLPADAMIIVPVRNAVMFPEQVMPITVGRPKSVAAAQQAMREQRPVGILMQREAGVSDPSPIDMHRFGTVANVVRFITAPDGAHHLICQGEQRFQVEEFLGGWPFFVARVVRIPEPRTRTPEIEARFLSLKNQLLEALRLLPQTPPGLLATVEAVDSPAAIADLAAACKDPEPAYLGVFRPMWALESLHRLKHHPNIIALFERLFGEPVHVDRRRI